METILIKDFLPLSWYFCFIPFAWRRKKEREEEEEDEEEVVTLEDTCIFLSKRRAARLINTHPATPYKLPGRTQADFGWFVAIRMFRQRQLVVQWTNESKHGSSDNRWTLGSPRASFSFFYLRFLKTDV